MNSFWKEFEQSMDGNIEKVPQVNSATMQDFYQIGRFLSHGFVMTGFFPLQLSMVCAKVILCGQESITEGDLVSSFY